MVPSCSHMAPRGSGDAVIVRLGVGSYWVSEPMALKQL
eukprot:COSAG02_NODE_64125_length_261_cov_0.858025_1_plen_37_part_10